MYGFTFCKYQQACDEGLFCQIRAVKAKAKLSQILKFEMATMNQLHLSHLENVFVTFALSPRFCVLGAQNL